MSVRILLQTIAFVVLLPLYAGIYIRAWNVTQGLDGYRFPILETGISHWRYLEFGRPFEALFSISASATTVFLLSIVLWWLL